MNVCLLIKEIDQSDCRNQYGHAEPMTIILGIYKDRVRAEKELEQLEKEDAQHVKEMGCDPTFYAIEERPLL